LSKPATAGYGVLRASLPSRAGTLALAEYEAALAASNAEDAALKELSAMHGPRRNLWLMDRDDVFTALGRYDQARACIDEALAATDPPPA
jgi:tetratricopeptide (TPR) repeat protein